MSFWTEPNQNGFVIKLSYMSCKSGVDYKVIIQGNGRVIYNEYFDKATNVTVKAHNNGKYKIKINIHIRR